MAKRSAFITSKPWGTEEVWATDHHSVGKILTISGSHRLSRKYHRIKRHNIRILEGTLTLEVGPRKSGEAVTKVTLSPGDCYFLGANIIHRFCAESGDVILLELSDAGQNDSVRLEDDYRRITEIPDKVQQSDK
jgi:mannose-6-phosphate isomerase-like protein (cupin superfamily)